MNYLDALRHAHAILRPDTYCEIGCRHGASLALSECPSVGIDPEFGNITAKPGMQLFEMTSDAFFARHDLRQVLAGPVDFSFIDGMHLAEFALRDFINLEAASHAQGVIAIDDILPDAMEHATRERNTRIWTGDVYRSLLVLKHHRPDLDIRTYRVDMKGFCLVSRLDPDSRILRDRLPQIEQALAAGEFTLSTTAKLSDALGAAPTDRIEPDLRELARRRNDAWLRSIA